MGEHSSFEGGHGQPGLAGMLTTLRGRSCSKPAAAYKQLSTLLPRPSTATASGRNFIMNNRKMGDGSLQCISLTEPSSHGLIWSIFRASGLVTAPWPTRLIYNICRVRNLPRAPPALLRQCSVGVGGPTSVSPKGMYVHTRA